MNLKTFRLFLSASTLTVSILAVSAVALSRVAVSRVAAAPVDPPKALPSTPWPEFRGPTGDGLSSAHDVPVSWSAKENVAWKVDLPGQGWSSPVLADGMLYVTAGEAEGGEAGASLRTLCLDAATGKLLWNVEVFHPDAATSSSKHSKNSIASSTPIVRGDRLYVHFGHMGTAALDLKGSVIWRQTEIHYPPVHGNGGSPVLVGDTLIFSCDGRSDPFVAALDANTGAIRWRTPRNTPAKKTFSFSTPLAIDVGGARQVVLPGSGFVAGYDPRDGGELWRVRYGEGYSVVPRPVLAHGLLFVSSGFDEPVLHAIKADGPKGDATDTRVAWTVRKGAPLTCSTLALGDELYFVSDGGVATCLDALTGKVHWTERLGGGFSSSPVAAEGRIYFQNEDGLGYVVRAGKKFEILSKNDLEDRTLASYAVSDGAIFIRTGKGMWRIGK